MVLMGLSLTILDSYATNQTNTTAPTDAQATNNVTDGDDAEKGEVQATILIKTSMQDACEAQQCENLQPKNLFESEVLLVDGGSNKVLGVYPASEEGTPVRLSLEPKQNAYFFVRQPDDLRNPSLEPWSVKDTDYSDECRGNIEPGLNKTCTITNYLSTKDSTVAHLNIVNRILNDCEPKRICFNIRSDEFFSNHVFTFESNAGEPYKDEITFPGSEKGWRLGLFPESNQIPIQNKH